MLKTFILCSVLATFAVAQLGQEDYYQDTDNGDDSAFLRIKRGHHDGGSRGGHHGGHHHHHPPPFLANVSSDARKAFTEIFNEDLTKNQVREKVGEWAAKQGQAIVKAVDDYHKKLDDYHAEKKRNTTKALDELPDVYPQLVRIFENGDLTRKAKHEQIRSFYEGLNQDTARVLHFAVETIGRHGHPAGDRIENSLPWDRHHGSRGGSGESGSGQRFRWSRGHRQQRQIEQLEDDDHDD